MREKLIELLMDMPFGNSTYEEEERHMEDLADYLIANGVTLLPCKIGDTVWAVRHYYGKRVIKQCVVSEMAYLEDMRLAIAVKADRKYSVRGFWGKDIFATRDECVAEVERRRG
jgi:hypothetical protein